MKRDHFESYVRTLSGNCGASAIGVITLTSSAETYLLQRLLHALQGCSFALPSTSNVWWSLVFLFGIACQVTLWVWNLCHTQLLLLLEAWFLMQICHYIYRTDGLRNLLLSIGLDSEFNWPLAPHIQRSGDCSGLCNSSIPLRIATSLHHL